MSTLAGKDYANSVYRLSSLGKDLPKLPTSILHLLPVSSLGESATNSAGMHHVPRTCTRDVCSGARLNYFRRDVRQLCGRILGNTSVITWASAGEALAEVF